MLKSYFTIAWRNFLRNRVISIVNIGGLMLGLTTGIIICLMVVYLFGFDKFHANYKDIHLVEMNQPFAGIVHTGNELVGRGIVLGLGWRVGGALALEGSRDGQTRV